MDYEGQAAGVTPMRGTNNFTPDRDGGNNNLNTVVPLTTTTTSAASSTTQGPTSAAASTSTSSMSNDTTTEAEIGIAARATTSSLVLFILPLLTLFYISC